MGKIFNINKLYFLYLKKKKLIKLYIYIYSPGIVDRRRKSRENDKKACYAEFCRQLCIKDSTYARDYIAEICGDFEKCKKFENTIYRRLVMRPQWLFFNYISLNFLTFGGSDEFYHKSIICALDTTKLVDLDLVVNEQYEDWKHQLFIYQLIIFIICLIFTILYIDYYYNKKFIFSVINFILLKFCKIRLYNKARSTTL